MKRCPEPASARFGKQSRHGPTLLCELGLMWLAIRRGDAAEASRLSVSAQKRTQAHAIELFDADQMWAQARAAASAILPALTL